MAHLLPDGEAAIWRRFFDFYRQAYDDMGYAAHQHFYNMEWETFPDQKRYDADAVESALIHASVATGRALRVWELGGWDGACAREMIERFADGIAEWQNIEICQSAAQYGWDDGGKVYSVECPEDWPWSWAISGVLSGYDIAILSHVIEHLSWRHLKDLFYMLHDVPLLYIQTPPAMGEEPHPTGWLGTMSTHKLEVGWRDVSSLLKNMGYTQIWQKDKARLFGKIKEKAHAHR